MSEVTGRSPSPDEWLNTATDAEKDAFMDQVAGKVADDLSGRTPSRWRMIWRDYRGHGTCRVCGKALPDRYFASLCDRHGGLTTPARVQS